MDYLHPYLPIVMILVFAAGFGAVSVAMGRLFGPRVANLNKELPYESGIVPTGEANVRIPVKFYMVGILFLLFDIESVFMLAWAVIFQGKQLDFSSGQYNFTALGFRVFAFTEMLVFMVILMIGYVYVWRKGGFRWS